MTGTWLVLQCRTVVPKVCSSVTLILNVTVVFCNFRRNIFSILRFSKDLAYNMQPSDGVPSVILRKFSTPNVHISNSTKIKFVHVPWIAA